MPKKSNKKKGRNINKNETKANKSNKGNEDFKKLLSKRKKGMITYKKLQNIGFNTFDLIFSNRQFGNSKIEDFNSFKALLEEIKLQFKPKLLYNKNISVIKKEGKFCLDKYNFAKIVPFKEKNLKNLEISINNRYIKTKDIKAKLRQFYINTSIFKGKHCFEINIINLFDTKMVFGLIDINSFDVFRKELLDFDGDDFDRSNIIFTHNIDYFDIESPILIKKNINNLYHHYLKYGDIIAFGFDLDNKLIYLFLNGDLVNTYKLHIEMGENISFIPFISLNKFSEILINLDEELKYKKNYKEIGFIPFNKIGENNYEISNLKKVTDDYINILINDGKSIIKNNNITYTDINEIYNDIFDFLGNISFQHSFITQNCFIRNIKINYENDNDFEFYYICIRYILNSAKDKNSLLKNIILNLIESIHIYLIKGEPSFKKLYNLLIFLLTKNDIIKIISEFDSYTMKSIFSQIFITFHPNQDYFNKINLDIIIKSNKKVKIENDVFKDLVIDTKIFNHYLKLAQEFYDNQNISTIFSKLVETIVKNGMESKGNENMMDNKIIKNLNDFFKSELKFLRKENICMTKKAIRFNDIFKSFFIPGMQLFNNLYDKNQKGNTNYLISYSVIKYLIKNKGEKLGGTMKYINNHYTKKINNYDEIINMKIDNLNSVFLIEFIELFFLNNNSINLWDFLKKILSDYMNFKKENFISSIKNNSQDVIHSKFLNFLKFKLFFPSLEEIEIIIKFLINFSNILLNDLYPSKLIYFFPVKIIIIFPVLISFVISVVVSLSIDQGDYFNSYKIEKKKDANDIIELADNCVKQYMSILSKIISDKCVKILSLKCIILNFLQTSLINETILTDEQIISLFNFVDEIHNNKVYKNEVFNFTKLFNNKFKTSEKDFTSLGLRLYKLFKQKENNNVLRIALILIYNNINSSLSYLEEYLAGFNQNFNSNNNDFLTFPISNNISNIIDRDNFNTSHFEINYVNSNNENNKSKLNNKEKLEKLNSCLIDLNWQFIKLNNFYSLASDIIELYDFNSFENKFLDNLLLSIYSIIFSSNNFDQIKDKKVNESYNKLINNILIFYNIIFKNISFINNENIKNELSKRRNIYHLKDIGIYLNKITSQKKNKKTIDEIKYFNSFLMNLEKIILEKDATKLINNDDDNNNNKSLENNNLCPICVDSVVNTHLLPCQHLICRNCYLQCISGNKLCPFCRVKIKGIKEYKNC